MLCRLAEADIAEVDPSLFPALPRLPQNYIDGFFFSGNTLYVIS
jgi:hypothetical protein